MTLDLFTYFEFSEEFFGHCEGKDLLHFCLLGPMFRNTQTYFNWQSFVPLRMKFDDLK